MVYQLTHHAVVLSKRSQYIVAQAAQKIASHLPHMDPDLPKLTVVVTKDINQGKYTGWANLALPRKVLRVKIMGTALEYALVIALKKLVVELTKYEARHFKGSSKYPNQRSIRVT